MAQVSSNIALNFNAFDLYSQLTATPKQFDSFIFLDNVNSVLTSADYAGIVGSVISPDVAMSWRGPGNFATSTSSFAIGGTDLVMDANQMLTSGTVSNLSYESGASYAYILGGAVAAATFQAAAMSQDIADDIAVLRLLLNGNDTITGSAFADNLFGAAGNDTIVGNAGHDTIFGDEGDDSMLGGDGADLLNGGSGNDFLFGNAGHDKLLGGLGDDFLVGGAGNDTLAGSMGADRITGNIGTDHMSAGADIERDVFIFRGADNSSADANRDVIYQFVAGTDDINLSLIDANTGLSLDQGFAFSGTIAQANSVWFTKQGADLIVCADVDGNTVADFSVQLMGVAAVTAGDFIL